MPATCPFCAEAVEDAAERCTYCGESLLKGSPCPLHPGQVLSETCEACGTYVCLSCKRPGTGSCDHCDRVQGPPSVKIGEHYDFGVILGLVFKDPDWVTKVLIGAACLIGSIVIVPMFGLLGYWLRIVKQQRRDPSCDRLPEFDGFGGLIGDGFKLWVAMIIPGFVFMAGFFAFFAVGGGLLAASNGKGALAAGGGLVILAGYLLLLIGAFAFTYVLPAIQMEYIDSGDLTAGLKVKRWWRRVVDDPMEYFLLFVFHYVLRQILGLLGMALCIVGVYASVPWSMYTEAALMGRFLAKKDMQRKQAGVEA